MNILLAVLMTLFSPGPSGYRWTQATEHAGFSEGYNFPLFNINDRLWVLQDKGNWYSDDGEHWTRATLPPLDFRPGYQRYVVLKGAIYALGTMEGNYLNLKIGSRIVRSNADFTKWDVLTETSGLPA